jgi:trehalose 6-phosphate phosphatase
MDSAPKIERYWSLFLDLDGTLLDIAQSPDDVVTPPDLVVVLEQLRHLLGNALAIVSGRRLLEIDHLLEPVRFAAAAEHGAIIRHADGVVEEIAADRRPPPFWASSLRAQTREWDGVLVEEKDYSIAMHYRLAPECEDKVGELAASLVRDELAGFKIVHSKKALEIRPKGVTKGIAVKALMERDPFRGRVPVFVGDDITDEDGMAMARELGGLGVHVAWAFAGRPSAVRAWLRQAVDRHAEG